MGRALVGDTPGGDLQGGEQRGGPVPGVVMGALLGRSGQTRRTGWVRSKAWIWDFSSTQRTTARSGGCRYRPTTSWTLAANCGSVENLKISARQGCTRFAPHSGDRVTAHAELAGQQPGRPVHDAQPGRWRVEGDLEDFGAAEPPHGLRPAWPIPVGQPVQAATHRPAPTGDDRRPRTPDPLGDLGIGDAVSGQQQDPGWSPRHGGQLTGPSPSAQLGQVVRSDGKLDRGRHRACSHIPRHRQTTSARQH